MQQTCVQCQVGFEVTDGDKAFYEKVAPEIGGKKFPIPLPKQCPDCRQQRRLAFANRSNLYRRESSWSKKSVISIYSANKDMQVYENDVWWSDAWDPLDFGRDLNLSQPVFPQLREHFLSVPVMALMNDQNENCPYVNTTGWAKNCHLCYGADYSEDCHYGEAIYHSKTTLDALLCEYLEESYWCIDCNRGYALRFSQNCENCTDSAFLFDCVGCKNCFGCVGLRQKKFCYFNEQLQQDEYKERVKQHYPLTNESIAELYSQLESLRLTVPHKHVIGTNNENSSGNYLYNSKNSQFCYDSDELEDCKYCTNTRGARDFFDVNYWGHPGDLCYECLAVGANATRCYFCFGAWGGTENMFFCFNCIACSNCFGCSALRHKEYCILNKQYSKEGYEAKLLEILEHMQGTGEWGEYMPAELSLFGYNESVADDIFPLSRDEIEKRGWTWQERDDEDPNVEKVIPAERLPDSIDEVPDDILNWAITCSSSGRPFKLIPSELEFYRRHKLPVPHVHPDERLKARWKRRNPRTLWDRTCTKCNKAIQTTYSPERPETVYCEECYLKEVY